MMNRENYQKPQLVGLIRHFSFEVMKPTTIRRVTTIQPPLRKTTSQTRRFTHEKSPEEIQEITSILNRLSASVQTRTVKLNQGQSPEVKPGPQSRVTAQRDFETEETVGRLSAAQLDVVLGLIEKDASQKNDLAEKYGVDAVLLSQAIEYVAIPVIQMTDRGKRFSIGPKGATFIPPTKPTKQQ